MPYIPVEDNSSRKKRILRASCIFAGVLLLLTFFSSTINNFSLPRVSVEQPVSGALIKEVTGEGIVQAKETWKKYAAQGRLVEDVRVKTGDMVKKGQILVVLDRKESEQQLELELLRYDQTRLSLEKLTQTGGKDGGNPFERDIAIAEKNAETARKNWDNVKALFKAGSASGDEVDRAEMAMLLAQRDLDNEYRKQRDYEIDLKNQQVSLRMEEIAIEKLRKELAEDCTLISPVDGIVAELNAAKGMLSNGSLPLFSVADTSKGFEVKLDVDKDKADYLKTGDSVEITVKSLEGKPIGGKLREIAESTRAPGEKKELRIDLPGEGILGGESAEIYIGKKTGMYKMLIPNSALGTNDKGKFVWVLQERKGPLGSEYFVRMAMVGTDESDSSKTAILSGLSPEEPVVVKNSRNLSDGCRVFPDK